jgi:thiamine-phosphate pyrophosphorylase
LIVNDDVEIAASSGADGVHLGRDDGDLATARLRLPNQLLGVSCYNEFDRACAAIAGGADAVAFGSMYPSVTKPAAVRAPLSLLTDAHAAWPHRRIIAIGGINTDNVATVAAAGADAAAVLDAIFGAKSPASAARELVRRFDEGRRGLET